MSLLQSDFPIELAEHIASELETIQDVLSFSLVCHHFHTAVNCDQSVYRSHFLRLYEPPRTPEGYDYKTSLQQRYSKIFDEDVLRDIILDARPSRNLGASELSTASSPNLEYLDRIFANTSPPSALRSLLYPLQFCSPTSPLFPTPNIPPNWAALILQTYPSDTDTICSTFATYLHVSNRDAGFLRHVSALLQLSEYPSFWEGDLACQATVVPTRWFGAYLYLPIGYNYTTGPLESTLMDLTLKLSTHGSFSGHGHDIGLFTIRQGTIQGEGDQRQVSWIKDYGSHRWVYQGVLEGGGQRMVGVWGQGNINGQLNSRGGHGLFMLWAVPHDSPSIDSRR
ncbi:hypothetical protein GALMADRAFT_271186 [Galerina marginata CBS 339.88]|uniref:F-box domain-containing protein n=1 Tax=Galerina marginata (strain CBS 339.88) TaxID=685588 RepID=A0A067SU78_GALM3|nr:hypothetical protein GALMADRAFT_271186 [Galerina marginata CBS 339.88]